MLGGLLPQEIEVEVVEVKPLSIHGAVYYDVALRVLAEGAGVMVQRVNPEAFYADPKVGDRVRITLMMGQVMGATRLT
jgi:hypothetical protein